MFTGIVECLGLVAAVSAGSLVIENPFEDVRPGDSIAVNGVCLTAASITAGTISADLSEETSRRTNLGALKAGDSVNLERPLPVTGRLGGHIVQGHVDGVAEVLEVEELDSSREIWLSLPVPLERYVVEKGSVALDGVSLTVSSLQSGRFNVSLIPVTLETTNLSLLKRGSVVNVEVDILAKYVERLIGRTQ